MHDFDTRQQGHGHVERFLMQTARILRNYQPSIHEICWSGSLLLQVVGCISEEAWKDAPHNVVPEVVGVVPMDICMHEILVHEEEPYGQEELASHVQ